MIDRAFLDETKPLARRYLTVTALRLGWYAINTGFAFYPSVVLPLPPDFSWPGLFVWVDLALALWQAVLLITAARIGLLRYRPGIAAKYRLPALSIEGAGIDLPALGRKIVNTPLILVGTVIFTCLLIQWLIVGVPHGVPFVVTAWEAPGWIAGYLLALAGFLYGNRFMALAKAQVGGSFGVTYLGADHPLSRRVAGHADTLGIKAPVVGVVDVTNAFAMGTRKDSAVVIGKPLLTDLTPQELDAVIGHELGHIVHNDVERMQFAEGFQTMLGHVTHVVTVIATILVAQATKGRGNASGITQLSDALGALARHTVFAGSELMVKGLSRSREFKADAVGASLTSPEAMIGALERIHGIPAKPSGAENKYGYLMFRGSRMGALFSTHPPLKRRTDALRNGTHLKTLPRRKAGQAAQDAGR